MPLFGFGKKKQETKNILDVPPLPPPGVDMKSQRKQWDNLPPPPGAMPLGDLPPEIPAPGDDMPPIPPPEAPPYVSSPSEIFPEQGDLELTPPTDSIQDMPDYQQKDETGEPELGIPPLPLKIQEGIQKVKRPEQYAAFTMPKVEEEEITMSSPIEEPEPFIRPDVKPIHPLEELKYEPLVEVRPIKVTPKKEDIPKREEKPKQLPQKITNKRAIVITEPMFIRMDSFRSIISHLNDIRSDLKDLEETVVGIDKEHALYENWRQDLTELHKKIRFIDEKLFER